ncbi:MAG: Ig-like domain-containing protein [Candidatus Omnitrophota bacterium]
MPKSKADSITITKFVGLALFFCLLFSPPALAYFLIKIPPGTTNQPPKVVTISPVSGTFTAQTNQIFATAYSDANGCKDIQYVYFLINTSANPSKCFVGYYNQITNKLYLRNDSNTAWLGGFTPRSSNTIENSYAKLDCSRTTVSKVGTILIIRWSITFTNSFAGVKNAYLYVRDTRGAYNGWVKKGTFTIVPDNRPPQINSITPADQENILSGAKINIQVNASDPDNDPLEYQFSIGGVVKQAWSSANTYIWQTTVSDTGPVTLTCEVRDNKGLNASQTITYKIINPTVEEMLQKVEDNYAIVNDKTMNVTMTSKFNSENFGETLYTRHYFKKPDKQRTDTFPSSDRADSAKTEIQITLGPDTYLIDPINNAKSHRNILTDLNLTLEQLNQMDEIYHLQDFIDAHTITRVDTSTDLANGLVMLEVIPKNESKIYSKLGLQIDYFKGLKTKSYTYLKENNEEKLKQSIEVTDTQNMPNGAWVPKTQVKTLYLTEGNLIMTFDFRNIQINTGLADYLFDAEGQ